MPKDEVKNFVTFLSNYVKRNAILLPGRFPLDDIDLLPSSTTKVKQFLQPPAPLYTKATDAHTCTRTNTHVLHTHVTCHVSDYSLLHVH